MKPQTGSFTVDLISFSSNVTRSPACLPSMCMTSAMSTTAVLSPARTTFTVGWTGPLPLSCGIFAFIANSPPTKMYRCLR